MLRAANCINARKAWGTDVPLEHAAGERWLKCFDGIAELRIGVGPSEIRQHPDRRPRFLMVQRQNLPAVWPARMQPSPDRPVPFRRLTNEAEFVLGVAVHGGQAVRSGAERFFEVEAGNTQRSLHPGSARLRNMQEKSVKLRQINSQQLSPCADKPRCS